MAFNTRKIKTTTLHGTVVEGVQGVDINIGGNSFDIIGDGNDSIEDTFVDGVAVDVVVTFTDVKEIDAFAVGDGGILLFVCEERIGADGAAAAVDRTLTIPAASLQSINYNVPSAGEGGGSLTYRCAGPAGAAIFSWA